MNKAAWFLLFVLVSLALGCGETAAPPDLEPPEVEIQGNEEVGQTPGGEAE